MGFIDKEQGLRQTELAVEQIKQTEQTRLTSVAAKRDALEMQAREEDRRRGPEDDATIVDLLNHLPPINFSSYLYLVEKYTGYNSRYCFYTRGPGIGMRNPELVHKIWEFSLKPDGYECYGTKHPKEMFCGTGAKPKIINYGGFLNLIPTEQFISEPQEPGIGICFEKSETRKISSCSRPDPIYSFHTREFETSETTSQLVFVRLLLPATAFITGSGQSVPITSMEVLDNAIEEGFNHCHTKRERYESEVYRDIAG